MSKQNNIFSAADIERYHKGLMDARERNALEKAALDDPFLADALEGYAVSGVHVKEDIDELKARLAKRLQKEEKPAAIIPSNRFYYLRVAAIVLLLAGAGWFIYQYSGGDKKDIAYNPATKEDKAANTDTTQIINPAAGAETNNNDFVQNQQETTRTKTGTKETRAVTTSRQQDSISTPLQGRAPGLAIKPTDEEVQTKDLALDKKADDDLKKAEVKERADERKVVTANGMARREANTAPVARGAYEQPDQRSNNFRGQVRGINNENIPFANVANLTNNSNTYTDANGFFTIYSPDTVVNVEVKSVGYEPNRALLRNNANADIILKNDRNASMNEVVVTAIGVKKEDDGEEKIKYDSEPVDGWDKYNAYLKNNIKIPANFTAPAGKNFVELTFEVGKKGKPSAITVDTSLNKTCDREAIRLLKEGPSWKKGNGKIRIYF